MARLFGWQKATAAFALVAIGLAIGAWWANSPGLPTAHAAATHGTDNLTAATGFVDSGAEAVIYLDHVTGELTGFLISPNTWRAVGRWSYGRVKDDLNLGGVRNPKFSVVTGSTGFKPLGGKRLGGCVVYVAEETTGTMCAYGMPWEAGNLSRTTPVTAEFFKLTPAVKISSAVRRGVGGEPTPKEEKEVPPRKTK